MVFAMRHLMVSVHPCRFKNVFLVTVKAKRLHFYRSAVWTSVCRNRQFKQSKQDRMKWKGPGAWLSWVESHPNSVLASHIHHYDHKRSYVYFGSLPHSQSVWYKFQTHCVTAQQPRKVAVMCQGGYFFHKGDNFSISKKILTIIMWN